MKLVQSVISLIPAEDDSVEACLDDAFHVVRLLKVLFPIICNTLRQSDDASHKLGGDYLFNAISMPSPACNTH